MNSHEVFIHIHQGCFAGTGAIVRLPQCQWSKPDGYGKISQCITTAKHSKAKTVCIFLGIYCNFKQQLVFKSDIAEICLCFLFWPYIHLQTSLYLIVWWYLIYYWPYFPVPNGVLFCQSPLYYCFHRGCLIMSPLHTTCYVCVRGSSHVVSETYDILCHVIRGNGQKDTGMSKGVLHIWRRSWLKRVRMCIFIGKAREITFIPLHKY